MQTRPVGGEENDIERSKDRASHAERQGVPTPVPQADRQPDHLVGVGQVLVGGKAHVVALPGDSLLLQGAPDSLQAVGECEAHPDDTLRWNIR